MDNGKMNSTPIGETALNEDKMNLVAVQPDVEIAKEECIDDITNDMKDTARDILQTLDHTKKFALMLDLKSRYPDMNMMDFVADYIGTNNAEGCNYEDLALEVENHFFKKIGSWVKSTADKAGDKLRQATKSVSGVFKQGGWIDRVSRSVDKATGGIYHKINNAKKEVAKKIPVVGQLVTTIDKALKGAKDKGKIDVSEVRKDIEAEVGAGAGDIDELAALVSGMVGTTMASENQPTPIVNQDRSVETIRKKEQTSSGIDKNTMLLIGGGLAALLLLKK